MLRAVEEWTEEPAVEAGDDTVTAAVRSRDGASARLVEDAHGERIELRDRRDRLLFEYRPETGKSVLSVPAGDLELRAPAGSIELAAGHDVRIRARRRLRAEGEEVKLVATRLETVADRIFEKARDVYRRVESLHQLEAGRARTLVRGAFYLLGKRTYLEGEEAVKIDAERIDLG